MKERPVLFSAPMINAILEGRKTQTRRVCKQAEAAALSHVVGPFDCPEFGPGHFGDEEGNLQFRCPYGQPGDRLYLKEAWRFHDWTEEGEPRIEYACDGATSWIEDIPESWWPKLAQIWERLSDPENYAIDNRAADRRWRPSIHMPRWASRILLEIVSVRVERLHDLSEADAIAEGIERIPYQNHQAWRNYNHPKNGWTSGVCIPQNSYRSIWEATNGVASWLANPWVWVIEFRRIEQ